MKWNKSPHLWGIQRRHIPNSIGNTFETANIFQKTKVCFRLPQDLYQTAKVAKILLLIEKGKGEKFRGKNLSEIEIENEFYCSSESEGEDEPILNKVLHKVADTEMIADDMPKRSTDEEHIRDRSRESMKLYICNQD